MLQVARFILKLTFWIFFSIVNFILIYFNGALWVRLDPPASALLTMPKLLYPNIINKAVYVYGFIFVGLLLTILLILKKRLQCKRTSKIILAIFIVTILFAFTSSLGFIMSFEQARIVFSVILLKLQRSAGQHDMTETIKSRLISRKS